jgi:hypothetical protein
MKTMLSRLFTIAMLMIVGGLLLTADSYAQGSRRAEPNVLSTGYYAVDSDDDVPTPWRPNYFFVDTLFQPFSWRRIHSGPSQPISIFPYYFYRPNQFNTPNDPNSGAPETMDTIDNAMAGPIPMGFTFNYYGIDRDSVYISTNGYIGLCNRYTAAGAVDTAWRVTGGLPEYTRNAAVDFKSTGSFGAGPPGIIALMFADNDFRPGDDSSKVYVRTSPSQDSFFVSYYNMRIRSQSSLNNIQNGPGRDRLFVRRMQIVLTRNDSSIQVNYGPFAGTILGFPPIQAWRVFQNNSSLGLVSPNRAQATSVLFKNRWDATNINCRSCNKNFRQQGQWAVKYKRWKNVVRAVQVIFPTRNYEICLGTTVRPAASYMNVDLVAQTFKVKFQIRNVVTGVAVYGRVVTLNNVLPGQTRVDSSFAVYATNPNLLTQLGTFKACAVATAYDATDKFLGDQWPFDDTVCIRVFGIRTTNLPFNDPSNEYSVTQAGEIPDQRKWVSIGAQVVDGDATTYDPPPPRTDPTDPNGFGASAFKSPVIKFDRIDIDGNVYGQSNSGDTLVSFPFFIAGQNRATLSFSYQRSGTNLYPWLWDAQTLFGPEWAVLNAANQVVRAGDSLMVEYKLPTQPACNPANNGWRYVTAIDGGQDFQFKKVGLSLEKYLPGINFFTKDFRFRLRLKAKYDGLNPPPPDDDGDDWFVDNIALQIPRKPEIEVMWVRVVTPYTKMPASQAVSLPVYVHLANNSTDVAISFPVRVQIISQSGNTVYWALQTVTSLRGGTDTTIVMPNWNAQNAGEPGEFIVHAWLAQTGYDSYTEDNGTFTRFFLDVNAGGPDPQEFAYDDNTNDWPGLTLFNGEGVGFSNFSGSFAMKFRLQAKDTLYGVRVYFANGNQSPDAIRLSVLKGNTSCFPSGDTVGGGMLEDVRKGQLFNQFWPYYFPKPLVLAGGTNSPTQGFYWISVGQLSLDQMMMGADVSRGGGRVNVADAISPRIRAMYNDPLGSLHGQYSSTGDVSCVWAIEQTASSGTWGTWMPSVGWWPTNSAVAFGTWGLRWGTNPRVTFPYNQAGSYTPMIRAMVSKQDLLPVELLDLRGREDNGKAYLTWATAMEKNNQGFYVSAAALRKLMASSRRSASSMAKVIRMSRRPMPTPMGTWLLAPTSTASYSSISMVQRKSRTPLKLASALRPAMHSTRISRIPSSRERPRRLASPSLRQGRPDWPSTMLSVSKSVCSGQGCAMPVHNAFSLMAKMMLVMNSQMAITSTDSRAAASMKAAS